MPARVPVTPRKMADTVTEPALIAVKSPREPAAFETVAIASPPASPLDVSQVTLFVMSAVVGGASAQVPVAVSCWCPPTTTFRGDGVMAIDVRVAPLTVSSVVPDTP